MILQDSMFCISFSSSEIYCLLGLLGLHVINLHQLEKKTVEFIFSEKMHMTRVHEKIIRVLKGNRAQHWTSKNHKIGTFLIQVQESWASRIFECFEKVLVMITFLSPQPFNKLLKTSSEFCVELSHMVCNEVFWESISVLKSNSAAGFTIWEFYISSKFLGGSNVVVNS